MTKLSDEMKLAAVKQFSITLLMQMTAYFAVFLGVYMYAQQSRSIAYFLIWISPALGILPIGIKSLLMDGRSIQRVLFRTTLLSAILSLVVGLAVLSNTAILALADPGDYYLSLEVWLMWFLPFHCVSVFVLMLTATAIVYSFKR